MGAVSSQGMAHLLEVRHVSTVTHVPGLICYLCTRSVPTHDLTFAVTDGAASRGTPPEVLPPRDSLQSLGGYWPSLKRSMSIVGGLIARLTTLWWTTVPACCLLPALEVAVQKLGPAKILVASLALAVGALELGAQTAMRAPVVDTRPPLAGRQHVWSFTNGIGNDLKGLSIVTGPSLPCVVHAPPLPAIGRAPLVLSAAITSISQGAFGQPNFRDHLQSADISPSFGYRYWTAILNSNSVIPSGQQFDVTLEFDSEFVPGQWVQFIPVAQRPTGNQLLNTNVIVTLDTVASQPGQDVPLTLAMLALKNSGVECIPNQLQLLFVGREKPGSPEIYVINEDGTELRNLTNDPGNDLSASWSPDGSTILFESDRDGNREIYLMNGDGSGVRNISNSPADDSRPAWSSDGQWIAFFSTRDDVPGGVTEEGLYTMRADGSGVSRFFYYTGYPYRTFLWRPNTDELAIRTGNAPGASISVVSRDGTGLRILVPALLNAQSAPNSAQWSPDGSRFAFDRINTQLDLEIFDIAADGTNERKLTPTANNHMANPRWSPDGKRILYQCPPTGVCLRTVLPTLGSVERPLSGSITAFEWSADGTKVAFVEVVQDAASRVVKLNVLAFNGKKVLNLTQTPYSIEQPMWRPRRKP